MSTEHSEITEHLEIVCPKELEDAVKSLLSALAKVYEVSDNTDDAYLVIQPLDCEM